MYVSCACVFDFKVASLHNSMQCNSSSNNIIVAIIIIIIIVKICAHRHNLYMCVCVQRACFNVL